MKAIVTGAPLSLDTLTLVDKPDPAARVRARSASLHDSSLEDLAEAFRFGAGRAFRQDRRRMVKRYG